ncbi:unnamed protein product [Rotaria sp. Silwood2]|nr:unnamed protein product [Rotaria sp. Silwood2]
MTSSQVCTIDSCKRSARVVCICCQQKFCIIHLNEHSDLVKVRLTPLAHELNKLSNQFTNDSLLRPAFLTELEKWIHEAHTSVNHFCEKKKQEFEEFFRSERDDQKIELNRLRDQLNEFIREEEATQEDIGSMKESIRLLQHQADQFELPQFSLSPLVIDDQPVAIHQNRSKPDDYLPLSSPYQTIQLQDNLYSIAVNGNFILAKRESKLCLLDRQLSICKEIPWTHRTIWDMFWSSTHAQFVIITWEKVFTLNDKTMYVAPISLGSNATKNNWYCGTCSNDNLFLSTIGVGPSIYKYTLLPSIQLVKEYQSPVSCRENERIQDLSSNNHVLVVVIENHRKTVPFDLCSPITLERRWPADLDSLT